MMSYLLFTSWSSCKVRCFCSGCCSYFPSSSSCASLFHEHVKVTAACVLRHMRCPDVAHTVILLLLSSSSEPQFALKVLLRDLVTRQPLAGASVDVYVNHTLRGSSRAGQSGEVLLWVGYSPGLTLTLLGHKEGFVPTPLPWSTTKRPSEWR